jgi:hypothetical protein
VNSSLPYFYCSRNCLSRSFFTLAMNVGVVRGGALLVVHHRSQPFPSLNIYRHALFQIGIFSPECVELMRIRSNNERKLEIKSISLIWYICEEKEGIQRVSITIPAADLSASFLPSFRFSTASTQQRQQKTLKIDPRPPFCDSYLKELPISELNRERHVIISDGHQNQFNSLFFSFLVPSMSQRILTKHLFSYIIRYYFHSIKTDWE